MENTYWNNNGAEQEKYDELREAVRNGYNWTQKTENVFHSYYRYFNDGDFPGWAKRNWSLRQYGRWGWELNEEGLKMQEQRITEAILKEYERYQKKQNGGKNNEA